MYVCTLCALIGTTYGIGKLQRQEHSPFSGTQSIVTGYIGHIHDVVLAMHGSVQNFPQSVAISFWLDIICALSQKCYHLESTYLEVSVAQYKEDTIVHTQCVYTCNYYGRRMYVCIPGPRANITNSLCH